MTDPQQSAEPTPAAAESPSQPPAEPQPQPPSEPPAQPLGQPPAQQPAQQPAPRRPDLKCPFCSGKRFDFGRDILAGPDPVMYCRKTPRPGRYPDRRLNLPIKGAVCLDCGFVVMMVDLAQLHAPIPRSTDPADMLARQANIAAQHAKSIEDEAADALQKMTVPVSRSAKDVAEALEHIRDVPGGFDDEPATAHQAEAPAPAPAPAFVPAPTPAAVPVSPPASAPAPAPPSAPRRPRPAPQPAPGPADIRNRSIFDGE